jgi:hypothetical protein
MHMTEAPDRTKFSFILGVKQAAVSLFFMILGGVSAASDGDSWDAFIEGLQNQKVLMQDQAEALKKHMREWSAVNPRLDWHLKIHTQAAWTEARTEQPGDESSYSTIELRRLRLGASADLGHNMSAKFEVNLVPQRTALHEAYLAWKPLEAFRLKVGFDKPRSSLDENTKSHELITVERSNISNIVAHPGENTGVMVDGKADWFFYGLGVFTDQEGVNTENEAPKYLYNAQVGVTFSFDSSSSLKLQSTYLHSNDAFGEFGQDFENGLTFGALLALQAFRLQAEVLGAKKEGEVTGGYLMPSYRSGNNQFVLRVEKAEAKSGMGVGLPGRYSGDTSLLTSGDKGDLYKAAYLGWNYDLGETSKFMLGAEGAELSGTFKGKVTATTVFLALRAAM